jgi:hypothetical protein
MPWKECNIVEERLQFIARLLDGEKMAGLVMPRIRRVQTEALKAALAHGAG